MRERLRQLRDALATGEPPGWLGPLAHPLRWLWVLYLSLERDRAFEHAAAMAYATLVALVPLLLLITSVLEVTGLVDQDPAGIQSLLFDSFLGDLPEVRDFLLPGLLAVDFRTLGVVGVLGLALTTWRLYVLVESAYAGIFGVEVRRTLQQRVLLFYVGLTLLPVLFVDAFLYASRATSRLGLSGVAALLAQGLVLLGALRYFPNTRVRWGPALAGTATSLLLMQGTHAAFGLYLRVFSGADPVRVIYGSLAALPVFLIWLWLLWLMVLVGVEVAAVSQNYRTLLAVERDARARGRGPHVGPGVDTALHVLAVVADRFERGGGPAETAWVAERTGIAGKTVLPVLEALEGGGFLACRGDAWLLVRPPEHLPLAEVVAAWRGAHGERDETEAARRIRADVDAGLPPTLAEAVRRWLSDAEGA
jgi:membrane protein